MYLFNDSELLAKVIDIVKTNMSSESIFNHDHKQVNFVIDLNKNEDFEKKKLYFIKLTNENYSIKKGIKYNENLKCTICVDPCQVKSSKKGKPLCPLKVPISNENYKDILSVISNILISLSENDSDNSVYYFTIKEENNNFLRKLETIDLIKTVFQENLPNKNVFYYPNFLIDFVQEKSREKYVFTFSTKSVWISIKDTNYEYVTFLNERFLKRLRNSIEKAFQKHVEEKLLSLASEHLKVQTLEVLSREQRYELFLLYNFINNKKLKNIIKTNNQTISEYSKLPIKILELLFKKRNFEKLFYDIFKDVYENEKHEILSFVDDIMKICSKDDKLENIQINMLATRENEVGLNQFYLLNGSQNIVLKKNLVLILRSLKYF